MLKLELEFETFRDCGDVGQIVKVGKRADIWSKRVSSLISSDCFFKCTQCSNRISTQVYDGHIEFYHN